MCSLGSGDDWRIGNERKVDTRVWYKVGLEFIQIDVKGSVEA